MTIDLEFALVLLLVIAVGLAAYLFAELRRVRRQFTEAVADVAELDRFIEHARASVAAEKGESIDDMVAAWRIPSYHFHQRETP